MADMRVLIVAAGRGTRAGLPYPKTLHPVQGVPILLRLLELFEHIDRCPTVVASPDGKPLIEECVAAAGRSAHIVVQPEPRGMGDAVLRFVQSPAFGYAAHVLLAWGDVPLIQKDTLETLVARHEEDGNDFTFPTRRVDEAYTVVTRDAAGRVRDVGETREAGVRVMSAGERDIGLFAFRKQPVFNALAADLPGKFGQATGEHGFLYMIGHLAAQGLRVEGIEIATELDLVSLNSLSDIAHLED